MAKRYESLEELIWEIRRSFRELAAAADRELEQLGIEAGNRALLEFLAREAKPISLSDLARKYSVSRQHIHQSLRRLPHPEWIDEERDRSDGRTVLLRLSRKGQAQWQRIRRLDRAFLVKLAARLPRKRVVAAARLLKELRRQLAQGKGPQS